MVRHMGMQLEADSVVGLKDRSDRCEVQSEKCAVAREERKEKREERWFGPQREGWWSKGSAPRREEGRAQREARRERQAKSR